jgi:hypothetical protein
MPNLVAQPVPPGDAQFYDNCVSPVPDGRYLITVNQNVSGSGFDPGTYFKPATQSFELRGPQFTLDPTETHATYPPRNSKGVYDNMLPYIVLTRSILPWEREIAAGQSQVPWMALLVFAASEVTVDPATNGTTSDVVVSALLKNKNANVLTPDIDPSTVSDEVLNSTCQTVTIGGAVFQAVTPLLAEMPFLALCRQIDAGKSAATGEQDPGFFSVVFANRFPARSGGTCYVHLVSLEGFTKYLVPGAQLPGKPGGGPVDVELVSLVNWSFTSAPEGRESFAGLIQDIVRRQDNAAMSLLRFNPPPRQGDASPAEQTVINRLTEGYVPVNYTVATGEQTFAWYRGPFCPVVPQPVPRPTPHYTSADELLIYLQEDGIFDVSYAAAWTVGRMMALADSGLTEHLTNLRRNSRGLVNRLAQRSRASGLSASANFAQLMQSNLLHQKFDRMITLGGGAVVTEALASPRREGASRRVASPALQAPIAALRDFMGDAAMHEHLSTSLAEDIAPVTDWLTQLSLLYNVPFANLAANPAMLPVESLRFFYVDPAWVDALTDGALSVGIESSMDEAILGTLRKSMREEVHAKVASYRSHRLRLGQPAPLTAGRISGILLRSDLVSGWPGLVVEATHQNAPCHLLRMDRLSSTVLLCLFQDVPDTVTFSEPQQGLRFGAEMTASREPVVALRSLGQKGPVGQTLGVNFPASGGLEQYFRPASRNGAGVLSLNGEMLGAMESALAAALGVNSITLTPSQFALQMVVTPEQQSFTATS